MVSISCRCGSVKLQLPSHIPRVTNECCCNHCFARVQYLESLGGPQIDPNKPLSTSKWDNKIQVLAGRDKLCVYKMTPQTLVVNIASTCCHTLLLGRHSGYDANCVTTCNAVAVIANAEQQTPNSRWFANQWDPERLSKLQPLVAIWVNEDDGSLTGEDGWEEIYRAMKASMEKEIPDDAEGETFDGIVNSICSRDKIKIVSEIE